MKGGNHLGLTGGFPKTLERGSIQYKIEYEMIHPKKWVSHGKGLNLRALGAIKSYRT